MALNSHFEWHLWFLQPSALQIWGVLKVQEFEFLVYPGIF